MREKIGGTVIFCVLVALTGCSPTSNGTSCSTELDELRNANKRAAITSDALSTASAELAAHNTDMRRVAALVTAALANAKAYDSAADAYQNLSDAAVDEYSEKASTVAVKLRAAGDALNQLASSGTGYAIGKTEAGTFNSAAESALAAAKAIPDAVNAATEIADKLDGEICS